MRRTSPRRAEATLLVTVGLSVMTAGCVSMPSGGPVQSFPVSQSANAQNQNILQIVPQPPGLNESPSDVVRGFLEASSSFVGQQQVAREYLTPTANRGWKPNWSATVYKDSPTVTEHVTGPKAKSASVTVRVSVQATLSGNEEYAVASTAPKNPTFHFDLVQYRGQWRIANTHGNPLLLTSTEFAAEYQLVNLYFFDPSGQHLVPDPVYVPLQDTEGDLLKGLVHYLIAQPPDWLGQDSATHTQFPQSAAIQDSVTLDGGTATVNLAGKAMARVSDTVKEQISAQLWWTLTGAGQGQQQQVKSIALAINGKLFVPSWNSPGNPVQNQANKFPPVNAPQTGGFYYLKPNGQLVSQTGLTARPATLATLGRGYKSLAVSPDGHYLAAVRNGTLYTGLIGGSLSSRNIGSDITSLSWDRYNYLWVVAGMEVYRLPPYPAKPAGSLPLVDVTYPTTCGSNPGDVTALRVAPDGVRVAIVYGGQQESLAFGAIAMPADAQTRHGQQAQSQVGVNLSPFVVCGTTHAFTGLSWYGVNDVIALDQHDDTVTDYPVNGGTPAVVHCPSGSTFITASAGQGLIVSQGSMLGMASSLASAWQSLGSGASPAFPG
jgi:hypothetical protein